MGSGVAEGRYVSRVYVSIEVEQELAVGEVLQHRVMIYRMLHTDGLSIWCRAIDAPKHHTLRTRTPTRTEQLGCLH